NVRTGAMTKAGEGTRPFFSRRGDRVIFSHEEHLWWAPVWSAALPVRGAASKANGSAKKMFDIRGSVASPTWSPDGSQLAFVSAGGDHSFIAIYEPKAGNIRFLEPSIDRDIDPRWSPDGKRIAYIRLFNITDTPSADRERIQPWAIRVVDAASGQGREVWRSGNTAMDSFSRLPLGENILQWAAGDRLVFASEKDGWAHLYSVTASGGAETALTPGSYEVENVAWAPDRSYVVVACNNGDIDHRHLWKVNIAGGTSQLTSGVSIEMYPVITSGGKQIAFMHSTASNPFLPFIGSAEAKSMRPLAPQ